LIPFENCEKGLLPLLCPLSIAGSNAVGVDDVDDYAVLELVPLALLLLLYVLCLDLLLKLQGKITVCV
jgi:hypothetical protein